MRMWTLYNRGSGYSVGSFVFFKKGDRSENPALHYPHKENKTKSGSNATCVHVVLFPTINSKVSQLWNNWFEVF